METTKSPQLSSKVVPLVERSRANSDQPTIDVYASLSLVVERSPKRQKITFIFAQRLSAKAFQYLRSEGFSLTPEGYLEIDQNQVDNRRMRALIQHLGSLPDLF